jgi:hypothetical protein
LVDQITGHGDCPFRIFPDRVKIADNDGWLWNTQTESNVNGEHITCVACWPEQQPPCTPTHCGPTKERQRSASAFEEAVSKGAKDLLKATPVARNTFPLVHEGFQDAYLQIRKQIFDLLLPVLQRQMAKSLQPSNGGASDTEPIALPKIYCTGHSLGGSLAQLFAIDVASNCEFVLTEENPPPTASFYQSTEPGQAFFASVPTLAPLTRERCLQPPIGFYSFGQPRVGKAIDMHNLVFSIICRPTHYFLSESTF